MLKPIGRPEWGLGGARFVAAESLLLSGLLLLAVYVLWDMGFILDVQVPSWVERTDGLVLFSVPWQPVLAVALGLAAYWVLQALGRDRVAYWLMASAAALPHAVPAWSHNRIEWHALLDFQAGLVAERSVYGDVALFVACLVGLIALHRTLAMRRLERHMLLRGVGGADKRRVMRYESLMLVGLIGAGLLLAALVLVFATVLARYDNLLEGSPLAIVALGGASALLLALTLLIWFRRRPDARGEDAVASPGAMTGS